MCAHGKPNARMLESMKHVLTGNYGRSISKKYQKISKITSQISKYQKYIMIKRIVSMRSGSSQ